MNTSIILFDGECNFCNRSVNFILRIDSRSQFKFASLQSKFAQELRKKSLISSNFDSILVHTNGKILSESSALLFICEKLGGLFNLFLIFKIFPTSFLNFFYRVFAHKRYKWFGKSESCIIPRKDWSHRYME